MSNSQSRGRRSTQAESVLTLNKFVLGSAFVIIYIFFSLDSGDWKTLTEGSSSGHGQPEAPAPQAPSPAGEEYV